MNELIEKLKTAIDEDERIAREADVKQGDPTWWVSPVLASGGQHFTVRSKRDNRPIARIERLDGDNGELAAILDGEAVARHIVRHDPARVLRQVAAHRTILNWAQEAMKMCQVGPDGSLGRPGEHMMGDFGRWNIEALAKAYGIE